MRRSAELGSGVRQVDGKWSHGGGCGQLFEGWGHPQRSGHDADPFGGEGSGGGEADACAGTGDDGGPSCKVEVHDSTLGGLGFARLQSIDWVCSS